MDILHNDVVHNISLCLPLDSLSNLGSTCSSLHTRIFDNERFWIRRCRQDYPESPVFHEGPWRNRYRRRHQMNSVRCTDFKPLWYRPDMMAKDIIFTERGCATLNLDDSVTTYTIDDSHRFNVDAICMVLVGTSDIYILNRDHQVTHIDRDNRTETLQLPAAKSLVGTPGSNYLFIIDLDDTLYTYCVRTKVLTFIARSVKHLSVMLGEGVLIDDNDDVWHTAGLLDNNNGAQWRQLEGIKGKSSACGLGSFYVVDTDSNLWRYDSMHTLLGTGDVPYMFPDIKVLRVTTNVMAWVVVIDTDHNVWQMPYTDRGTGFTQIPGAKAIDAYVHYGHVYMLGDYV